MILGPHAVVYPGTVMVKPLHAPVADAAVPRPRSSDNLAVRTEKHGVKALKHILKQPFLNKTKLTMNGTSFGFFRYPGSETLQATKTKTVMPKAIVSMINHS